MSSWLEPRKAIREGGVVFFPNIEPGRAFSIMAHERKLGMKIKVVRTNYQGTDGVVVWKRE